MKIVLDVDSQPPLLASTEAGDPSELAALPAQIMRPSEEEFCELIERLRRRVAACKELTQLANEVRHLSDDFWSQVLTGVVVWRRWSILRN